MLTELIDEIEDRLRLIIREELRSALLESKIPFETEDSRIKTGKEKKLNQMNTPTILTAGEVAEILGVSVQRVYELVRTRKTNGIPVILLGERQYRFSKEAVLEWISRTNQ